MKFTIYPAAALYMLIVPILLLIRCIKKLGIKKCFGATNIIYTFRLILVKITLLLGNVGI